MAGIRQYALFALALLLQGVMAKTDLDGCTSFTSMASIIYFMPDNLEICQFVDCGGGRAPPKTVPGCPLYSGTETVTPSFLKSDPFEVPAQTTVPPSTTTTLAATATEPANSSGSAGGSSTGAEDSPSTGAEGSPSTGSEGVSSSSSSASPSRPGGSGTGPAATTTGSSPSSSTTADSAAATKPVNLALGILAAVALL